MTDDEAFKIIQRQAPCPHDGTDETLGDGSTWTKCYDCGHVFRQDWAAKYRENVAKFDNAISHLRNLVAAKEQA